MEQVGAVLLRFPPAGQDAALLSDDAYDKQIKTHANRVQALFKESVQVVAAHATDLLNQLDPAVHTYSYLALLDTIIPTEYGLYPSVQPVIANKIVTFLSTFDPRQVRYIGSAFTHIFAAVGSGKIIPAPLAVELLAHALEAVDPSGHMMTSNHLTLAKLAYHTNNAAAALPVLGKDIVFFPGIAHHRESERLCNAGLAAPWYISKDTGLTLPLKSTQVLEFDYLVGLLHLSVRDWAAAHAAFARVVSYPTRDGGISKIMVEGHKFWVLTGLLLFGRVPPTPSHTAQVVTRVCTSVNKLYMQIAEHFQEASAQALHVEVALAHEVLAADGTTSLVNEVVATHPKWQIAHLRNVYIKIAVSAIRATLQRAPTNTGAGAAGGAAGPEPADDAAEYSEAEVTALIQDMIRSDMIKAVLRSAATATSASQPAIAELTPIELDNEQPQPGAYLEFLPEEEDVTEAQFAQHIAGVKNRLQALKTLQQTTDEHLSLDRDYLRQVVRDQMRDKDKGGDDDGMGGMGGMVGYDSIGMEDPDEDLMMDGPEGGLYGE
ncbi:hypothetical protein SEUCBS140593_002645 [Sporothrix eucalyptigena]|uniref:COP9 signalosome complex subunit 3 N-terminal helical repeats domain-containing protein n=1 Tax=Sporothrix eucalyptigena TaxID=1812306 RepID=A0ABP0B8D8_9PEZI